MDDIELEKRLSALEKKIEANTVIVRKLYNSQRRAKAMKMIYWLILIGFAIFSYTLVKPYITQMKGIYGSFNNAETVNDYSELLNNI